MHKTTLHYTTLLLLLRSLGLSGGQTLYIVAVTELHSTAQVVHATALHPLHSSKLHCKSVQPSALQCWQLQKSSWGGRAGSRGGGLPRGPQLII